jgi:hypothetical protein
MPNAERARARLDQLAGFVAAKRAGVFELISARSSANHVA